MVKNEKELPYGHADSPWTYRIMVVISSLGLGFAIIFSMQCIMMIVTNVSRIKIDRVGIFYDFGFAYVYAIILGLVVPIICAILWHKLHEIWYNNNAPYLNSVSK